MNAVAHDAQLAPSPADRIVTELLAQGRLKEADLQRARQLQRESGGELLVLLARLGLPVQQFPGGHHLHLNDDTGAKLVADCFNRFFAIP